MNLEEFKDAATLAKEVSPEVYNFIYCYKDTALNKFNPPFINDKEPSFMVDGIRSAVMKGTAKQKELAGLEFCFVGTFELTKGKMDVFDEPQILCNLDEFFAKFGGIEDGKIA